MVDRVLLDVFRPLYIDLLGHVSVPVYDILLLTAVADVLYDMIDSILPCSTSLIDHLPKLAMSFYGFLLGWWMTGFCLSSIVSS